MAVADAVAQIFQSDLKGQRGKADQAPFFKSEMYKPNIV